MRPGAQIAAAIEILSAVEVGEQPADDVLASYFRCRRYIGAKDRTHIGEHVYAVLRHRAMLDWWLKKQHFPEIGSRSRMLAALVLIAGWRPEAIASGWDGGRFRPAPLSGAEQRLLRGLAVHSLRHPAMSRAVAHNFPEWLEPYLERAFGSGLQREAAALSGSAPIDLRINLLKADRERA
ncbi:MAG: rRNA cytosine-C5-methylase, partial [Alphaproteobacteria bacterium]|nr:rRNA cytosine-C5-methylase [Alphaproteobacteria bacterium]